ncbi:MMPL family transporter [Mesobacillus subterraneus]|uniref:efflux RND transporter permease subunit n=1 Tax=Mesobacillus subterraneus TaxID=285983 RepID=UPI00204027EF|nr:MMPL family transporter [Mesobacillus subterraneus]MCM3665040.1 MMPL family transporter [Mesobacillus subterraneus]MCM3684055.1 MMPL family transporter [Mesobacillus subterraneus]
MEKNNKQKSILSLKQTVKHIVPAVMTAIIATGLGFMALFTSPVPMIQDFGKMLTLGIVISFFAGLFILIPILFTRDHFFAKESKKGVKTGESSKSERFLEGLTKKVISLKWLVILLALSTAVFGIWGDLKAGVETDVETFMPQDTQELKDIHKLRDILGTTDQVTIMYSTDNVLDKETINWTGRMTESITNEFPEVVVETKSIASVLEQTNDGKIPEDPEGIVNDLPEDQVKLLVNEGGTKGVITVGIKHLEASALKEFIGNLESYVEAEEQNGIDTTVTGKSVLDVEMVSSLTSGRHEMTLLGIGLVFIGLLAIYRHPVKAFIPLLPILFIVGWSGGIMYLFDISYTPLTATLGALIIGIGTEFTILIMERFYEERKKGFSGVEAILIANKKIGKAVLASGLSVIGGFSALLVSDFVILSNFGMMTLINVFFSLISTIIVMPAILVLLDRLVKTKTKAEREVQTKTG